MSKKMQRLFSLLCVAAMLFTCTAFSEEELPGSGASEIYAEMSVPEETYAEEPAEGPGAEDPSGEETAEEPGAEDPSGEEAAEEPGVAEASGEETAEEPSAAEASGEETAEEPGAAEASGEETAEEPGAAEVSGEETAEEPGAEEASGEAEGGASGTDGSAGEASSHETSPVSADIQVSVNHNEVGTVRILQYPDCSVVRLLADQGRHLNLVLEADMNFVVSLVYEPDYSAYGEPHYLYSENNRLVMKFDAQAGSYLLFVYAAEYNKTGSLTIRLLDDNGYAVYSASEKTPETPAPAAGSAPAEDPSAPEEPAPDEEAAPIAENVSGEGTAPQEEPADEDQPAPAEEPSSGEEVSDGPASGDGSEPADEPAPAEKPASAEEPVSGEEVSDEPASGDESEPAEEPVPAEEPAPAEEADLFDSAVITVDVARYLESGENEISLPRLFARAYDALTGTPYPGLTVLRNEQPDGIPYVLSEEFLRNGQVSIVSPGITLQGNQIKLTDSFDRILVMIQDDHGVLTITLTNYSIPSEAAAAEASDEELPTQETADAQETAADPSATETAAAEAPEPEEADAENPAAEAPAPEEADAEDPAAEDPAAQASARGLKVDPSDLYVGFNITWDDEVPSFGSVAHLDAVLDGFEDLDFSLQWQYSEDNLSWTDVEGGTQSRMDMVITEENYLYYWRVMVYINVPAEG